MCIENFPKKRRKSLTELRNCTLHEVYFIKLTIGMYSLVYLISVLFCFMLLIQAQSENIEKSSAETGAYYREPSTVGISIRRVLSLAYDWFTGENVRTVNGVVPRTSCRLGYYRPAGGTDLTSVTALRADGCIPCPRGKYGSSTGLQDSSCSGNCPLGKFSTQLALTDVGECKMCPLGRYGSATGMYDPLCSSACAAGKYVQVYPAKSSAACVLCPLGYSGKHPCSQDMTPREPHP